MARIMVCDRRIDLLWQLTVEGKLGLAALLSNFVSSTTFVYVGHLNLSSSVALLYFVCFLLLLFSSVFVARAHWTSISNLLCLVDRGNSIDLGLNRRYLILPSSFLFRRLWVSPTCLEDQKKKPKKTHHKQKKLFSTILFTRLIAKKVLSIG